MPFREVLAVPVPPTLVIPTCDRCGSEWIDTATAKALDEALSSNL
jgi:hypothetical protein